MELIPRRFMKEQGRRRRAPAPLLMPVARRSPLNTALVILGAGFLFGGTMWFWSDGLPGQVKAYAAVPMDVVPGVTGHSTPRIPAGGLDGVSDKTAALIQYAQVVLSTKSGEEKLAEVTGQPVGSAQAGTPANQNKARQAIEAGNKAFSLGKYADAIKHFTQAIELDPKLADVRYRLALAYLRIGDKQAARAQQTALATMDKGLAGLLVNLTR